MHVNVVLLTRVFNVLNCLFIYLLSISSGNCSCTGKYCSVFFHGAKLGTKSLVPSNTNKSIGGLQLTFTNYDSGKGVITELHRVLKTVAEYRVQEWVFCRRSCCANVLERVS